MSTLKQQEAVREILENRGTPLGTIMRRVGYDDNTAKNPMNLTESKGFKEEMASYGLTEQFVTENLVFDITAKPLERVKELSLAADILGMKKADTAKNQTINVNFINSPEVQQQVRNFEEQLKKQLTANAE